MQEICFEINGKWTCFPIPVLLAHWRPLPDPDPGPLRAILDNWVDVRGPTPNPWKGDLPIIATVEALAHLAQSHELKDALQEVVQVQTDKIAGQLPEGATLDMAKERMTVAAR